MTAGLPLMKNALTLLPKSTLVTLGLTAAVSATDAAIQNKKIWIMHSCIDNLKQRNGRYHENSEIS